MTGQPEQPSSEPWGAMDALAVPPPYTHADFQAIVDALGLPYVRFLTVYVPRPGVRVVMGEPWYPVPLSVTLSSITDALQDTARLYLEHLSRNAHPRRGVSRKPLTTLRDNAKRVKRAMQALYADLEGIDPASRAALYHQVQSPLAGLEQLERLKVQARRWTEETDVQLTWLLGLVEPALQSLEIDPGGHPPNTALHFFIRRLCFLYQCVTGNSLGLSRHKEGKPSGPLFRFICTCLARLTPHSPLTPHWGEECNAEALYGHIRTVLDICKDKKRIRTHNS